MRRFTRMSVVLLAVSGLALAGQGSGRPRFLDRLPTLALGSGPSGRPAGCPAAGGGA